MNKMILLLKKIRLTLFLTLSVVLFLFIPSVSQAVNCQEAGGTCIDSATTTCSTQPGVYDPCPTGEVCCAATAADYEEGSTGGFLLLKGHLVPCGRKTDDGNKAGDQTAECTLCHLFMLLKNIFDLMLSLVIVAAILMITVGGVVYIVSMGSPSLIGVAKSIIKKTLIGFGLMIGGWLMVYTLLTFVSTGSMLGKGTSATWFDFTCDETSLFSSTIPTTPINDPDTSEYTYDPGIQPQYAADASDPLKSLLACMQDQLATDAKKISSISDSKGMATCTGSWARPPCAHSEHSCHYGGTTCVGQSYAVDFGNEAYYTQILAAATSCAPGSYVKNEGDHIHVSIGTINGCGCN